MKTGNLPFLFSIMTQDQVEKENLYRNFISTNTASKSVCGKEETDCPMQPRPDSKAKATGRSFGIRINEKTCVGCMESLGQTKSWRKL